MTKPRILVVGAGPTGLTTAVELARHGIFADVIEKSETASTLSRAVGLLPASLELLRASGVSDKILLQAMKIERVVFHRRATAFATLDLDQLPDPDHRLFALAQDRTENILRETFEHMGGTVLFGHRLESLSQTPDEVTVQVKATEQPYDYVIGADGINSAVRQSIDVSYDGYDLPEQWSIADVDVSGDVDPNVFQVFLLPKGGVAITVPLEHSRFRVIANQPNALAALPSPLNVTTLHRAGSFTISVRQVSAYSRGRVYLAGDAAHCHSPVGGRGMNLGIADACDLARRFATHTLDGYDNARHTAGQAILRGSETGRKIVASRNPIVRATTITTLALLSRIPPIHRRAVSRLLDV